MTEKCDPTAATIHDARPSVRIVTIGIPDQNPFQAEFSALKVLCHPDTMGDEPFRNVFVYLTMLAFREALDEFFAGPHMADGLGYGVGEVYGKNCEPRQSVGSHRQLKTRNVGYEVGPENGRQCAELLLNVRNQLDQPLKLSLSLMYLRRKQSREHSHLSLMVLSITKLSCFFQFHGRSCDFLSRSAQPKSHEAYEKGCGHRQEANHYSQGIPPHHAIINAKRTAPKNTIKHAHSLIPLWIGRHSAMACHLQETAHG